MKTWFKVSAAITAAILMTPGPTDARQPGWNGVTITPEARCSPYDADDYRYSPAVEDGIVRELGGVYGPYTGRWFRSATETDIEHIVARSEAHDSGLCAAGPATRRRFAEDPLNLTLASPAVNRNEKSGHDAAGWLPPMNRCWFTGRVIAVKRKYRLTMDRRERDALAQVLARCTDTTIQITAPTGYSAPGAPLAPRNKRTRVGAANALVLYDDNGNGRITCAEARRHGITPVRRDHPAYAFMRDGDADGTVCE